MKRQRHSKGRETSIDSANKRLIRDIRRIQSKLVAQIEDQINDLDRDGKTLKDSVSNISKIAQLNKLYRDLISKEAPKFVESSIKSFDNVFDQNAKYFEKASDKDITSVAKRAKSNLFKTIGLNTTTGKIIVGGLLHSILYDESPVNKAKSFFLNALKGSTPVKTVVSKFREIGKGIGKTGLFEKHFFERLPRPFEGFDRTAGQIMSSGLDLNHAIYQGGLIAGSRPFCRERNNKVFSREEIERFGTSADQFGGYTNKGNGEFQGKPDFYNPFSDLGGINCRHQLDWISDELAFSLRPDLKP